MERVCLCAERASERASGEGGGQDDEDDKMRQGANKESGAAATVRDWDEIERGRRHPLDHRLPGAFEFAAELAAADGNVQLFARSEGRVGAGALESATIVQATGSELRPRVLGELGERLFTAMAAHGNSTGRARTQEELDYLVERAQIHQFATMAADGFATDILCHLVNVEDTIRENRLDEAGYTDADLAQAILLCTRLSRSGALRDQDEAKLRQIQRAMARAMAEW